MIASNAIIPELELSEDESKLLAASVTEVAAHYSVVVDPKIVAWAGLFGVCGSIYGPRIVAWRLRKSAESKPANKNTSKSPNIEPIIPGFDYEAMTHLPTAH